ncbi:MAG: DUF1203 domain-containing protein [Rhizobiaceae bacterium]|nr:DUF1203 domain-containing protein [Rhizobiaceae bacterium]
MLKFSGMNSRHAHKLWQGGADDFGNRPETSVSDGSGNPCRHCLKMIQKGERFMILSYRPFDELQPYAEQGPVFLHAEPCESFQAQVDPDQTTKLPAVLCDSSHYLMRGYDARQRTVYGSGTIVEKDKIKTVADTLLAEPSIEFIHVRSSTNNCWQARIDACDSGDQ